MHKKKHLRRMVVALTFLFALALVAGYVFFGDDDDGPTARKPADGARMSGSDGRPLAGVYVGTAERGGTLVAVVAEATGDKDKHTVTVFASDGRKLSEWFPTAAEAKSFEAKSSDGDASVTGSFASGAVSGSVKLADGRTLKYQASRAGGAAGLYDLSLSRKGRLKGATPFGVGARGTSALNPPGSGSLKLADGSSVKFAVAKYAGDKSALKSGQVRLIVTADGKVAGIGRAAGSKSGFLVQTG